MLHSALRAACLLAAARAAAAQTLQTDREALLDIVAMGHSCTYHRRYDYPCRPYVDWGASDDVPTGANPSPTGTSALLGASGEETLGGASAS